jgi:TonB family protein
MLAVLAVAGIAFASIAPAPSVAVGEKGTDDFDVRAVRSPNGGYILQVNVRSKDGGFTLTSEAPSVPDTRTITSEQDGRVYKIVTRLSADGTVIGNLEVKKDGKVVFSATRSFGPADAQRDERPAVHGYERVGGAVKAPTVLTRMEPHYPERAKVAGISGIVILEVLISERGEVDDVKILKPLPEGLAEAAVDAVRQWRFEPGTIDGKPVPVAFNLTIQFRLDDEE